MKWISITLLQNIKKKELLFHKYAQIFIRIRIKRILFLRDGKIRMFFINHDKGKNHKAEKEEGVEEWKKKAAQSRVRLDQDKEAVARE